MSYQDQVPVGPIGHMNRAANLLQEAYEGRLDHDDSWLLAMAKMAEVHVLIAEQSRPRL